MCQYCSIENNFAQSTNSFGYQVILRRQKVECFRVMEYSLQLRNKRFILTRNYSDGNNQMCRSAVFWGQEKMVTLRVSDNTGPACHHSTEESDDRSYRMENAEVPVSSDIWRKISFKQTCVQNTKKTLGMTLNLRVGGVSIVSIFAEKLKVSEV